MQMDQRHHLAWLAGGGIKSKHHHHDWPPRIVAQDAELDRGVRQLAPRELLDHRYEIDIALGCIEVILRSAATKAVMGPGLYSVLWRLRWGHNRRRQDPHGAST